MPTQPFPAHALRRHLPRIRAIQPASQAIQFCPADWDTPLLGAPLGVIIGMIPELENGVITRAQVVSIGTAALQNGNLWDPFFLAVMIWAFGTVGYGRWRTEQMFTTQRFHVIFANIRDAVFDGRIPDAYSNSTFSYCGPPFFTKILYFSGKVRGLAEAPLILDSRVAHNLTQCNGPSFFGANYYRGAGAERRFARGYADYCNDMHEWGHQHQFEPDQLELFLFCPPIGWPN